QIAANMGKKVYLHLITDGRDVAPDSARTYTTMIKEICNENISIATVGGRYYAMDRDNNWDRIQKAYSQIVDATDICEYDIDHYIEGQYKDEIFDEFLEPICFNNYNGIKCGDLVIFTNFRSDRARELSAALAKKDFDGFETNLLDIDIITMTAYDKNLPLPIMFPKTNPTNTISEVVANAGLKQLHTAETEKYAHVTFFFNGGIEEPFKNEDRVLIPSPKVATYDLQPEMSAKEVSSAVQKGMDEAYDLIVANFANGDMVGHTGAYEAGIKAVETVDYELGVIINKAKELGYNILLTSDHGNCEMMKDENGNTLTNHTVGDVFCFVVSQKVETLKEGGLNNIAPTVLKLMDLDIPTEMDAPLF
ncbi:MAG TPA: phosphoglycerate mutase (2,3-diphosphoglycerate-independent), partial [Arcobacter sp.]|nr:phosphoglycerate mutase (2,3-diphosphoglycerate-independent) [Arcobacter sp.]